MSEIKKTAEQVSFELISHAGNSKSCSMEAMVAAERGNYELVDLKLKEADEELREAHQIQTSLLTDFARGEKLEVDVLLVHAQDHLNGAILTYDFAKKLISLTRKIQLLEEKMSHIDQNAA